MELEKLRVIKSILVDTIHANIINITIDTVASFWVAMSLRRFGSLWFDQIIY